MGFPCFRGIVLDYSESGSESSRHPGVVLLRTDSGRTGGVPDSSAGGPGVVLGALIVVTGSMVGLLVGVAAWAGDTPIRASDIILVHVQLPLFGLAAAVIALVVATWALEPGRTYGVGALIVVVMYVLHLVAQVVASLEWADYPVAVSLLAAAGAVRHRGVCVDGRRWCWL